MELTKLSANIKSYIWGGQKLREYGKVTDAANIAETWELSFNEAGPSLIESGENKGKRLMDVVSKEDLGANATRFPFFPVLIKLIDSASDLSVQVHPSDSYALEHEHQLGKTEMWHILDSEPGAGIYLGFKDDSSEIEVENALKNGSILSLLNFFKVKKGETYFIPSGTIHAIGGGVTLIEIQQNSTLTYRLYDYDRIDKDGKKRELHIDKALKVIDYKKYNPIHFDGDILGKCPYFITYEREIDGEASFEAPLSSFLSLTCVEGEGKIGTYEYHRGDTFFLPASKKASVSGTGRFILVSVEGK